MTSTEAVLEELGIHGDVISLTGRNGIMDKVSYMDAFGRVSEEIDMDPVDPNTPHVDSMCYALLPDLLVMPATSAANCVFAITNFELA